MSEDTAKMARLMRVTDAVIEELERQGVTEVVADLGFDPMRMAKAVIRAADGDVIPFPGYPEEATECQATASATGPLWTVQRVALA